MKKNLCLNRPIPFGSDPSLDAFAPQIAARRSRYPAGRESTEEEIANAVWFLGSEQSASMTGTDLTVDSGLTACLLPYKKEE